MEALCNSSLQYSFLNDFLLRKGISHLPISKNLPNCNSIKPPEVSRIDDLLPTDFLDTAADLSLFVLLLSFSDVEIRSVDGFLERLGWDWGGVLVGNHSSPLLTQSLSSLSLSGLENSDRGRG